MAPGKQDISEIGGLKSAPRGNCGAGFSWPLAFALATALCAAAATAQAAAPEAFGRLFTTPQQRSQLDELREALPQAGTAPAASPEESEEPDEAGAKSAAGTITVKGLVTRRNGESAAWINDSNTFEGDIASQYLHIESKDIHARGVDIEVPDQPSPVRVKVGETYDPVSKQTVDLASPEAGGERGEEAAAAPSQPAPPARAPR